jgi:small subunit ribosomal protein S6
MPLYDLMLLLDPGVPSDRQETILRDVQGLIESGGNLVGNYDWGTRRMTFEIDHRPDAAYHLFQFETEPGGALLERVDHSLKIMDGVLRHRIIRLKDGTPPPQPPRAEGRYAEAPPVAEGAAADEASPLPPEEGEPAAAPAIAGTAAAGIPAAPSDEPAPAPAETPPPPDVDVQEAGPAGGGGDDEAPSGPTAA